MKNLTPKHLHCDFGASCPSIHELPNGKLLIIGKAAMAPELAGVPNLADDEDAVIIERELLSGLVQPESVSTVTTAAPRPPPLPPRPARS